ncbi:phosphoenolpyruvate--protein phosphotransferase [Paenibacillus sp. YYML68]|uniref:phosphoenolpyruvate--protein phosphotransferase n=1 Tax=Paenibacillus sp. YYML68 TaxID=2909250 RepID=UPI002492FB3F|nr:phosphoenolpyruvate--protein phosphotransferase [Paenibacillus sp. YYML68]
MTRVLKGIAASPGIAIAKAYRLRRDKYIPVRLDACEPVEEASRLQQAVEQARHELEVIREKTEQRLGAQKAEIFEAHLMLLEDPELMDAVMDKINTERINAEYALHEAAQHFIDLLSSMDDELLRGRAADVQDVVDRMLSALRGETYAPVSAIDEQAVIVAEDLTPSDTAQLDLAYVQGFATEVGSRTSHSAIMARSLEIAAVVGAGVSLADIPTGTMMIVDATEGRIIVDPSAEELRSYQEKKESYERRREELRRLIAEPTVSCDGRHVELAANIGSVEDVQKAIDNGAEGIGLFRTEFLYMGRSALPTEEEQYQVYRYVLEKMNHKPVVIRTLDIGGDKELPYLQLPKEMNPFLGQRALRLCLNEQELFRTQLRALLRASRYGQLKIMFPMIAVLEELLEAKRLLQEEKERLQQEGVELAEQIEVGMMIEIPSAALAADSFAAEVDFFSIGTNDLIQYTMAADRMNETVSYLYQPCHPSIVRLIEMVIRAAEREGKWVGMCGEMAGDESAIPILLGMGLHEFSMSASSILPARAQIKELSQAEWAGYTRQLLSMRSEAAIQQFVYEKRRRDS